MDVNRYRALFIEESREHLAQLSRLLVDLESSSECDDVIDEVFRIAHSIKGMAAAMGYEPIAEIAHRMEDVVGAERGRRARSEGTFSSTVVDLLLRSNDVLVSQVEAIAAGESPLGCDDLASELVAATQGSTEPDVTERPPEPAELRPSNRSVCVRLTESCSAPAVRAFLVYRKLSALGDIVVSEPSLDEIKAGQVTGVELRFVFALSVDPAHVRSALSSVSDVKAVSVGEAPSAEQVASRLSAAAAGSEHGFGGPAAPADDSRGSEAAHPTAVVATTSAAERQGVALPARGEATRGASTVRIRTEILDTLIDTVGELFIDRERLRILLADRGNPEVTAALDGLDARIRRIHDRVMAVRMLPLRTLTDRYPRLVRDLCQTLGKDVDLEISGEEIELDRAILDSLDVPLIHALRNAIDHGIESSAERVEHGKNGRGRVSIRASRERDTVAVTIEDDGRGLDPKGLRRVAVQRGLLTEEQAEALTLRETYALIFLSGFSSKTAVTEVSGRGVGMDVVRAQVESLGGSIDIESTIGGGTRLTLRLPLTLAIVPALLVRAGGRVFAVPVAKVAAVRDSPTEVFERADGTHYMVFDERLVPVSRLSDMLQLPASHKEENVLVIGDGRQVYAVAVERIVGYHEVVVKPLGEPLDWLELFSGATILGDGSPVLILDVPKALRAKAAA